MTNRRDFLQGAAVAAVPLVADLPDEALALEPVSGFHAVLIDPAHAEARAFGARFEARGARVKPVPAGDITALWLADIAPAWRKAPVPLAGLTQASTLFCLEQLAWSHGLRVVFHAEHVVEPAQATAHVVHRANEGSASLRGPWWPVTLADLLARQGGARQAGPVGPSLAGLSPALSRGAELLTSWIIAPA